MNRRLDSRTRDLDAIKLKYDVSGGKDREQLKVEWYKKLDDIAAEIRQEYDKNKKV